MLDLEPPFLLPFLLPSLPVEETAPGLLADDEDLDFRPPDLSPEVLEVRFSELFSFFLSSLFEEEEGTAPGAVAGCSLARRLFSFALEESLSLSRLELREVPFAPEEDEEDAGSLSVDSMVLMFLGNDAEMIAETAD